MPAKFDHRTFVRMDHGLPEHPKFVGLTDRAFRVWFNAVCWSSRQEQDGHVPDTVVRKALGGTPKVIRELIDVRLFDDLDDQGRYRVHDYLDFQRSREEIEAFRSSRGDAGTLGNHKRWHVARRRWDSECQHCREEGRLGIAK